MSAPIVLGAASGRPRTHRIGAFFFFLLALAYGLVATWIGTAAANGLTSGDGNELLSRSLLLFLLLIGYWGMGRLFQGQRTPLKSMGLIRRVTAWREFGVGAAFGWGAMVACVLPIALFGGMTITFWTSPRQFVALLLDVVLLLVAALVEEVAFRGYPFQRLIDAIGPVMATVVMSVFFAFMHLRNPDSTMASTVATVLAGVLLSIAYLRTRALWLPWGLHFAWNVTMGVLFGLPVSGLRLYSPVISTTVHGPLWLTGDGYGPEGSLITTVVLVASLGLLVWLTGDFAYEYAQPVIVAGGIPVDIDAAAARQHDAAMASPAEVIAPKLVQILPAMGPPEPQAAEGHSVPENLEHS